MVASDLRHIAGGRVRSPHHEIVYDFYTIIHDPSAPIHVSYTEDGAKQEFDVDRRTLSPLVKSLSIPIEVKCALIVHSRAYQ